MSALGWTCALGVASATFAIYRANRAALNELEDDEDEVLDELEDDEDLDELELELDELETSFCGDALDAYREFHWGDEARECRRVEIPEFDRLFALGQLRRVDYETTKDGETAIWFHDFEDPLPTLTATPDGTLGPILGGGAVVTARGIEG